MVDSIDTQIENVLEKIRPFLQREGGDIQYIGFLEGVVYVVMQGACQGCMYVDADISAGVEIILMEEVPGVIKCDASGNFPPEVIKQFEERTGQPIKSVASF
ncbi:MAG: NifU family protein [Bacilli bacterium]|nr:NifU family protein [Bacilli bacterium]